MPSSAPHRRASPQRPSAVRPRERDSATTIVGADVKRCIYCQGTAIIRQGFRYKKHETVQLWYCHVCLRTFTPKIAKGKTYPLKVILESLVSYYQGHTRAEVARQIRSRFGLSLPERTLSGWLAEYRELTTYGRLRDPLAAHFPPRRVIHWMRLHHQQVYRYGVHRGKLAAILGGEEHGRFAAVGQYLAEMASACPHHLFRADSRASQDKAVFDLDGVEIRATYNHACRIAGLVVQSVVHHKRRHDELQRFMLATDSVTVAVEVPIVLTPEDLGWFKAVFGYRIPLEPDVLLTGHIDVLQVRNGAVHVLDYKPGANSEKPITQLMVYTLALSRRMGIDLFHFVCGWFDEHNYFEFYPRHVVRRRRVGLGG
ncbi:MAG: PD-(D/E)XK nuclease family protein [Sphingobium sp.]